MASGIVTVLVYILRIAFPYIQTSVTLKESFYQFIKQYDESRGSLAKTKDEIARQKEELDKP